MSQVTGPGNSLSQNAFLQLMVTQMQYQDPLQPQSNSQFLSQLAQFTSLEQMTNVANAEKQNLFVGQLSIEQKLIGQTVTFQNADQTTSTGTVTGIKIVNGTPQLMVDGSTVALTSLTQIGGA